MSPYAIKSRALFQHKDHLFRYRGVHYKDKMVVRPSLFKMGIFAQCGNRVWFVFPDSKVHGAYMVPISCRQDPGGPHVGPMNFAIWVFLFCFNFSVHFLFIYSFC